MLKEKFLLVLYIHVVCINVFICFFIILFFFFISVIITILVYCYPTGSPPLQ